MGIFPLFLRLNPNKYPKKSAEALYGASVDIDDFRTSLTQGSIGIGTLAFSDKQNLENNKIKIKNINFTLVMSELLKKKIIIEKINTGEIQFDTKRKSPATLIKKDEAKKNSAFILKEKIKDSSTDFFNFTTDLNDLSTTEIELNAKDIERRIDALKNRDLTYIKISINEINNIYKKIKKEKNPIKKIKHAGIFSKKIKDTKNKIKNDKKSIEKEFKSIKEKIKKLKNTSISKLKSATNLLDKKKLETLILAFTKNKINHFISPWMDKVDKYKEYLPKERQKFPLQIIKKRPLKK